MSFLFILNLLRPYRISAILLLQLLFAMNQQWYTVNVTVVCVRAHSAMNYLLVQLYVALDALAPLTRSSMKEDAFRKISVPQVCFAFLLIKIKFKIVFCKGPSIKDVRTKSRKIDPFPLVRKLSALDKPSPSLTDCGRILWTAPNL